MAKVVRAPEERNGELIERIVCKNRHRRAQYNMYICWLSEEQFKRRDKAHMFRRFRERRVSVAARRLFHCQLYEQSDQNTWQTHNNECQSPALYVFPIKA